MLKVIELILDPECSDGIPMIEGGSPIWIISSKENDAVAKAIRGRVAGRRDLTVIFSKEGEASEDVRARAVYAIDDHFNESSDAGGYESIHITGSKANPSPDLLHELSLVFQEGMANDFSLVKV